MERNVEQTLNNLVTESFRNSDTNLAYVQNLNYKKRPKRRQSSRQLKVQKKSLTRKEMNELGLFHLPRKAMQYKQAIPLNKLWKEYLRDLLDLRAERSIPDLADPNHENISNSLMRSDFHGAEVIVVRSKNTTLVGQKGIVVLDTKNTFQIVTKEDKLKTIPKFDSVFEFICDSKKFTIFGKHLSSRPAERSVKKTKVLMNPDL